MKQGAKESLRSYFCRFIHVKRQSIGLNDDLIIDAAKQSLRPGPLQRKLTRSRPESISELMRKLEQDARAKDDELRGAQGEEEAGSGDPRCQRPEACPFDHRPEKVRDCEDWRGRRDPPGCPLREVQHVEPSRPRSDDREDCKRGHPDEPRREKDYRNAKSRQENTSHRDNPRPYCIIHEHSGGHNTRDCPSIDDCKEKSRSEGGPSEWHVHHAAPVLWPA